MTAPALGIAALVVYAASQHRAGTFGVGIAVAVASFLVGSLLGFLFAVPRSLALEDAPQGTGERRGFRTNSNLEQISDWLTKILVGLGLVELGTLIDNGRDLLEFLEPGFGDTGTSRPFAFAIVTLFTVSGFLVAYLITRIYFSVVFAQAERQLGDLGRLNERLDNVRDEVSGRLEAVSTAVARLERSQQEQAELHRSALEELLAERRRSETDEPEAATEPPPEEPEPPVDETGAPGDAPPEG